MDNDSELIKERGKKRFQMLRAIYMAVNGDIRKTVGFNDIASEEGLSEVDTQDAFSYLKEEKLIVYILPPGRPVMGSRTPLVSKNHRPNLPVLPHRRNFKELQTPRPLPQPAPTPKAKPRRGWEVKLTHNGRKEVEQSIMNPDKSTDHFAPQINQHFHAPVGSVQNAAHSTANVNQNIGATMPEILSLVGELRHALQALPVETQQTTSHMVDIIEAEVQSDTPNVPKVKSLMDGITALATATSKAITAVSAVERVIALVDKIKDLL